MRSFTSNATLSIAVYAVSAGASTVFAHDGHGLGGGAHWHATDVWGFVVVGVLSALAIWIARKESEPTMIPGETIPDDGPEHVLNAGRRTTTLVVQNTADRPIQVGSHYHFAETNGALGFDRAAAQGMRLNIASGSAVRFEPGQQRTVELVDFAGDRIVYGFRGLVQGKL